jgi:hypothetical protein
MAKVPYWPEKNNLYTVTVSSDLKTEFNRNFFLDRNVAAIREKMVSRETSADGGL